MVVRGGEIYYITVKTESNHDQSLELTFEVIKSAIELNAYASKYIFLRSLLITYICGSLLLDI